MGVSTAAVELQPVFMTQTFVNIGSAFFFLNSFRTPESLWIYDLYSVAAD